MECKKLNRKVWLFITVEGRYIPVLDKSKVYNVVGVIPHEQAKDWQDHLLVRNGNEMKEIPMYECIAIPDEAIECESQRLHDYLSVNGLYHEVFVCSDGTVEISIEWGDWKHDHGYCDSLMSYIGYDCDDVQETEENGSDCYSAIHYYSKSA